MSAGAQQMLSYEEIRDQLESKPIGFSMTGRDSDPWLPADPHREHDYDPRCALCSAGSNPRALLVLINRIVNLSVAS